MTGTLTISGVRHFVVPSPLAPGLGLGFVPGCAKKMQHFLKHQYFALTLPTQVYFAYSCSLTYTVFNRDRNEIFAKVLGKSSVRLLACAEIDIKLTSDAYN